MNPVVIIPVYNHEHAIGAVVDAVRARGLPVLLVDDGSMASCATVLDGLVKEPDVRLFRRTQNGRLRWYAAAAGAGAILAIYLVVYA